MNDDEIEALLREIALEDRQAAGARWDALAQDKLTAEEALDQAALNPELAALFSPLTPEDLALDSFLVGATPRPANRPWRWASLIAVVAAAVFLITWLPSTQPLPTYTITAERTHSVARSDPLDVAGPLTPGRPALLRLRPATRTKAPVRAVVLAAGHPIEPVQVRIAESGAIEIRVPVVPSGVDRLVVLVHPPGRAEQAQRFEIPIALP